MTRNEALKRMNRLAGMLAQSDEWNKKLEMVIWRIADRYNEADPENEIAVIELEEGLAIEDDIYYFDRY